MLGLQPFHNVMFIDDETFVSCNLMLTW